MPSLSSSSQEIDISRSNVPLHIKFALFCLSKVMIPKWLGSLFFALSHIQILAIIIKSAYIALPDNTPNASPVIKLLVKLFVIGDWWNHGSTGELLAGTLIITFYTLKVLGLMIYIHVCLFKKYKIPAIIQSYWSLIHRLHPLLLFFWIHTFCIEIIKYSHDSGDFNKPVEVFMTVMAYLNTIINCVLAVFFSVVSVIYKTKDVMSSKTNILETKSIIFKIIIPALWRFAENYKGIQILILVLTVLNSITHDLIFIRYLPYYRVNTLIVSAVFQAMETSLALVCFIVKVIEASRSKAENIGIFSVQMVWLIVAPIFMKLYFQFTWKILLYIFRCEIKSEKNVYYLVHKRFLLLHFLKSRKAITPGVVDFSDSDIMYQARLAEMVIKSQLPFEELDIKKKSLIRSLKMTDLEILSRYPRALLVQINLANSLANFEDLYLVSNNLLEDSISKKPGYQAQISLNLIRFELQKRLKTQFSEQKTGDGLHVYSFIMNQELHEEMKKSIEKQAEMQLSFWKEFVENNPNMLNLMKIAFKVQEQRMIVKKLWNNLMKIRPLSFVSPLTVYGMYSSFINNSPVEGGKYLEQSQEDMKKLSKVFQSDELNHETIFSDQVVRITMSGMRAQLGKIIDCSKNIADFYGWKSSDMKGRPATSLMPPFFRSRHDGFLLNHFNTGKTKIMDTNLMIPVKRSNGFIHPSWIHVKVSPLMENGMSYIGLIRPFRLKQRMVLLCQDGKIDDMSFEFAKDMNLMMGNRDVDLITLCSEFKQINEAFNMMAKASIDVEENNNTEALSQQNDLILQTFHSSGNKKGIQKTNDNLLTSERGLIQGNSTMRITERHLLLGNNNNGPLKDGTDEDETSTDNGIERFNCKSPFARMDKNKAQSIYDTFVLGSNLVFNPQNGSPAVTYNVKISNNIYGKDVIKYVLLEKISGEDDDEGLLSGEGVVFSSFKMMANKFMNKNDGLQTEILPSKIYKETQQSGTTKRKFSEDEDLSILDEIQDADSAARHVIARNFLKDDTSSVTFPQKTQGVPLTEPNETRRKSHAHHTFGDEEEDQKERMKKLKERLKNVVIIPVAHLATSVGSSYTSKGKKIQQMVVQALTDEPKKKSSLIFAYLSVLFLILMIILLIVQNLNLHTGIANVESQLPTIGIGLLTQYNMMYSASMLRQWKGTLDGVFSRDWVADNLEFNSYLIYYTYYMNAYNSEYYELLAQLPVKIQSRFSEKNVGIYDYNEDGTKTLINKYTSFEAVQLMVEKESAILNMVIPDQYTPDIDKSNFNYVLDNIMNDLLVQSETQSNELISDLNNSTGSTTSKIGITLAVVLTVCFIFGIISVRYLWMMASQARIFMTMIFSIKSHESETMETILQQFISALDQDLKFHEKIKIEEDLNNNAPVRFRNASMGPLYKTQIIAFLKLLPIFSLFFCWSLVYFFVTSDFIANIRDTQKRSEASLQGLNLESQYIYETFSVPLTNSTALIRNGELMPSYMETLNELAQVDAFVDGFRDRHGKLTDLQEKLLFSCPCEDWIPIMAESEYNYEAYIYAYESCVVIAKGKKTVGLVNVLSALYANGMSMLEQYENSNKTTEELGDVFLSMLDMNYDLLNVAEGFLGYLYGDVTDTFYNQFAQIKRGSWYLLAGIIVVTLIMIWGTWFFVMKRIFKLEKIDWFILQIIPIQVILGNKHIQQYLLKHSDGRFDNVRSYL